MELCRREIFSQKKPDENANHCRKRHGKQHTNKAEQRAKGEQRKHQPDGMKPHCLAKQLRLQDIPFQELPHGKYRQHGKHPHVIGPELRDRIAIPIVETDDPIAAVVSASGTADLVIAGVSGRSGIVQSLGHYTDELALQCQSSLLITRATGE